MLPPHTKIDVHRVRYPVTRQALSQTTMLQTQDDKSTILVWYDGFIPKDQFLTILPHQRVNKIPGMDVLCYKSSTFKAFNQMRAIYPKVFTFYPLTFLLPFQFADFQKEHLKLAAGSNKPITWIFKPRAGCSGNGIKLIQNSFEVADNSYSGVIQRYVSPYLLDGYKFDFRLYIFIPTVEPFTVYLYRDGLARFCTDKYESPSKANLSDRFCHLSNTSVNVGNKEARINFCQMASKILDRIRKIDVRGKSLWPKIKYAVMLSMVAQYPQIMDQIQLNENDCRLRQKVPFPEIAPPLPFEQKFFHILGIDIMLNDKCEPVVLEMNDRPSMLVTFDLENNLKTRLTLEAMKLISLDGKPPPPEAPTGSWEKIMPIDESTQLGIAIKRIMEKSLQTVRNLSTVPKFYRTRPSTSAISGSPTITPSTTMASTIPQTVPKPEQSTLPPLHSSTQ